jgi:Gpi18-like mannosyltransferase
MSERLRNARYALIVYGASRVYTAAIAIAIAIASRYSLAEVLSRWDGGWYLSIVLHGYPSVVPAGTGVEAQSSIAFFPGYPLLVRAVSASLGLSPVLVGVAISTVFGGAAALIIGRLARDLSDERAADRTVVLFSFFPSAFVLSMLYADAMFIFLAALCLVALVERRWLVAGAASAVATCVRPTGVVLVACCLWGAVDATRRQEWSALVAPVLAPLGALVYLAYLRLHTGDLFAFTDVESRGWGRRFDLGASNARAVWTHVHQMHVTFFVVILAMMVIGTAFGALLLIRWRPPAVVVVYVVGIVALTVVSTKPTSLPRYFLSAFPVLIPIATRLSHRAYLATVGGSAALLAVLFVVTSLSTTLSP